MKIGFVFQKDSHLKAVEMTALRVMKQYADADICFFGLMTDGSIKPNLAIPYRMITYKSLSTMTDCDYLICCLGGYSLNQLIKCYEHETTKVIALFPGIVSHYQLDAFITRFNADQVWLNCPADRDFYARLCHVFNVQDNGILYGIPWVDSSLAKDHPSNNSVIFFEQTQLIVDSCMADKVATQLVNIIQSKPDRPFIYKTRNNMHNEYLLNIRDQVQSFPNVKIVHELSRQDVIEANEYLSISSSAIIEGLLQGKQCYLLSNEYLDDDNREIFGGSGIFLDDHSPTINRNWLAERVCMPSDYVDLQDVKKQHLRSFYKRNILTIVWQLMSICLYYPKLSRIAFDRTNLKAVQKSLEYLS